MKLSKGTNPIATVEQWQQFAPPRSADRHWVDGRSAKELAVAWCGSGDVCVPEGIRSVLKSHPDIGPLDFITGEPEKRIRIDDFAGEPRNADLAILARDPRGDVAITIEAKADETFGDLLEREIREAAIEVERNPRSRKLDRIRQLYKALIPPTRQLETDAGSIRYQLLTAAAGTLAWATSNKATRAVLLIQEFTGPKTTPHRVSANAADLDAFVTAISGGTIAGVPADQLVGPIRVPGGLRFDHPAPLYIGKTTVTLGT